MKNKELHHEYTIIEYLERISIYDQSVILYDGEYEYSAMLSCGELVDINIIN